MEERKHNTVFFLDRILVFPNNRFGKHSEASSIVLFRFSNISELPLIAPKSGQMHSLQEHLPEVVYVQMEDFYIP